MAGPIGDAGMAASESQNSAGRESGAYRVNGTRSVRKDGP